MVSEQGRVETSFRVRSAVFPCRRPMLELRLCEAMASPTLGLEWPRMTSALTASMQGAQPADWMVQPFPARKDARRMSFEGSDLELRSLDPGMTCCASGLWPPVTALRIGGVVACVVGVVGVEDEALTEGDKGIKKVGLLLRSSSGIRLFWSLALAV